MNVNCLLRRFGKKKIENKKYFNATGDKNYDFDKCFIAVFDKFLLGENIVLTKSQHENIKMFLEYADEQGDNDMLKQFDEHLATIGIATDG